MANILTKLFNPDKKHLKKIRALAEQVDALNEAYAALSDEQLKAKTDEFRALLAEGKTLDDILFDAFATAREAARRVLNQFPYLVQIMGAIVLHQGDVAEMKTGEGKTLTATMTVYLNALKGEGVHVVTVNEYLASRDAEWMGAIYRFLGLTVGVNLRELSPTQKKEAFACDITYTTNSEVGFDYLRDNMASTMDRRVLRGMNYAVIDEADSILIDESRTPLIISGGKRQTANLYQIADRYAKGLRAEVHFSVDIKQKAVFLTDEGVKVAERNFGLENLYDIRNSELVHHIQQALKANYTMQRDVEYMVRDGQIVIIDAFTGRTLEGREFSDGLHQALQAKERVAIKEETVTLATITYQNLFRLYGKLSGMTGTAKTEEEEFQNIYNMRVLPIPTNLPIARVDDHDLIFPTKFEKLRALVAEVRRRHDLGQPILIGTVAVESSEEISEMLRQAGLPHELLNAKNHAREADIIAAAGQRGAITLATNMAGRGTDIKIDDEVKALGGLAVLGSERHEARRIDNQLRGRSGRQGDPGYSRFYISFDDNLLRRFGDTFFIKTIKKQFETYSTNDSKHFVRLVTKLVTDAQKQIEGANFDIRKDLIGYDDVLRQQREVMYATRDKVILNPDAKDQALVMYQRFAKHLIASNLKTENREEVPDLKKINKILERLHINVQFSETRYQHADREELAKILEEYFLKVRDERIAEWGDEFYQKFERDILLLSIDKNWQLHIDRMAKLREGIHLRSFAQSNPLQAYISEGFQKFNELGVSISEMFTQYALHARPANQPHKQAESADSNEADGETDGAAKADGEQPATPSEDPENMSFDTDPAPASAAPKKPVVVSELPPDDPNNVRFTRTRKRR